MTDMLVLIRCRRTMIICVSYIALFVITTVYLFSSAYNSNQGNGPISGENKGVNNGADTGEQTRIEITQADIDADKFNKYGGYSGLMNKINAAANDNGKIASIQDFEEYMFLFNTYYSYGNTVLTEKFGISKSTLSELIAKANEKIENNERNIIAIKNMFYEKIPSENLYGFFDLLKDSVDEKMKDVVISSVSSVNTELAEHARTYDLLGPYKTEESDGQVITAYKIQKSISYSGGKTYVNSILIPKYNFATKNAAALNAKIEKSFSIYLGQTLIDMESGRIAYSNYRWTVNYSNEERHGIVKITMNYNRYSTVANNDYVKSTYVFYYDYIKDMESTDAEYNKVYFSEEILEKYKVTTTDSDIVCDAYDVSIDIKYPDGQTYTNVWKIPMINSNKPGVAEFNKKLKTSIMKYSNAMEPVFDGTAALKNLSFNGSYTYNITNGVVVIKFTLKSGTGIISRQYPKLFFYYDIASDMEIDFERYLLANGKPFDIEKYRVEQSENAIVTDAFYKKFDIDYYGYDDYDDLIMRIPKINRTGAGAQAINKKIVNSILSDYGVKCLNYYENNDLGYTRLVFGSGYEYYEYNGLLAVILKTCSGKYGSEAYYNYFVFYYDIENDRELMLGEYLSRMGTSTDELLAILDTDQYRNYFWKDNDSSKEFQKGCIVNAVRISDGVFDVYVKVNNYYSGDVYVMRTPFDTYNGWHIEQGKTYDNKYRSFKIDGKNPEYKGFGGEVSGYCISEYKFLWVNDTTVAVKYYQENYASFIIGDLVTAKELYHCQLGMADFLKWHGIDITPKGDADVNIVIDPSSVFDGNIIKGTYSAEYDDGETQIKLSGEFSYNISSKTMEHKAGTQSIQKLN